MSEDLFAALPKGGQDYDASAIEVLEGLEPVRRRPGMYVGGTDERALHHLAAEVLDNSMDEAVAGHATRIEVTLDAGNRLTISDNGRGIPVDPHPKFPQQSALEVIMTTLHSGGKFEGKAYATSGGLHGVGISVVNALSSETVVEVARAKQLFRQRFARGKAIGPVEAAGAAPNRRGTTVSFVPDTEIFGEHLRFKPQRLYRLARSKAYLFAGVEIRWKCASELIGDDTPAEAVFQFPGGLADHLREQIDTRECATAEPFTGEQAFADGPNGEKMGRVEWAVAWPLWSDGSYSWYCNTIPTPDGGAHEAGLRAALTRGLRGFGELVGQKKAKDISAEDVLNGCESMLSLFIRDPQFQSQTKDRLTSPEATRLVEAAMRDHFDHFLSANMDRGKALLTLVIERMDERLARRAEREVKRKTATSGRKLRLPGKLTDCANDGPEGTELFIVEGDSAGGSAKAGTRPQDTGGAADPRQDPQRRVGQRRQDSRQQRNRRSRARDGLRHAQGMRRRPATLRTDHHHDRRRRGRRAHCDFADDVLLSRKCPRSFGAGISTWRNRRSIGSARAGRAPMRRTKCSAQRSKPGCSRARRSTFHASRGWAR